MLRTIHDQPEVRAADLAPQFGRERLSFKLDVRKLKELGLTESLPRGYRLSPRGRAALEWLAGYARPALTSASALGGTMPQSRISTLRHRVLTPFRRSA